MVYILLAPGFEEMEALVPADLLRRAGIETKLIAVSDNPVPGSHGITVSGTEGWRRSTWTGHRCWSCPGA